MSDEEKQMKCTLEEAKISHEIHYLRGLCPPDKAVTCPNYCADLNACHEVEKGLSNSKDADRYARNLMQIVCNIKTNEHVICMNGWALFRMAHASARHRALALLKTLKADL